VALASATDTVRAAEAAPESAHVALVLPLASPAFGRHADAVRQGFLAASRAQAASAPPVRVYAVNEDAQNLLTAYEQAVESGAQLVVGPLTRNGVASLATSGLVKVPTLALNSLDARSSQPPRLYLFGLAIETEARQVAHMAFDDGRRNAFVISDDTPLSKRMRQAFLDEFAAAGGSVVAEFSYGTDAVSLNRLRHAAGAGVADAIFLALDFGPARTVRPYLGNAIAIYATSQIHVGRASPLAAHELNLVRFVDMPWLLQTDHPAVMVYPRAYGGALEFERLYALGIDAFRLGLEMLRQNSEPDSDTTLDGVTGRIRLAPERQFVRELTAAQYVDGRTVILREPRP